MVKSLLDDLMVKVYCLLESTLDEKLSYDEIKEELRLLYDDVEEAVYMVNNEVTDYINLLANNGIEYETDL